MSIEFHDLFRFHITAEVSGVLWATVGVAATAVGMGVVLGVVSKILSMARRDRTGLVHIEPYILPF